MTNSKLFFMTARNLRGAMMRWAEFSGKNTLALLCISLFCSMIVVGCGFAKKNPENSEL
jgi:hypothetical protein